MRMKSTTRKIRMNKKLKLHIRSLQSQVRELRMTNNETDLKVANLLDESISLNLLQYNYPSHYEGVKKATVRLDKIQKELEVLTKERIDSNPTMFYATT